MHATWRSLPATSFLLGRAAAPSTSSSKSIASIDCAGPREADLSCRTRRARRQLAAVSVCGAGRSRRKEGKKDVWRHAAETLCGSTPGVLLWLMGTTDPWGSKPLKFFPDPGSPGREQYRFVNCPKRIFQKKERKKTETQGRDGRTARRHHTGILRRGV